MRILIALFILGVALFLGVGLSKDASAPIQEKREYGWVSFISCKEGNTTKAGSGFWISPTKFVTASHVIDKHPENCLVFSMSPDSPEDFKVKTILVDDDITVVQVLKGRNSDFRKPNCSEHGEDLIMMGYPQALGFVIAYGRTTGFVPNVKEVDNKVLASGFIIAGMSGGPVINDNQPIGVISGTFSAIRQWYFQPLPSTVCSLVNSR